ncbi:MAG: hypothetical protein OEV27_05830 [Nitrospira sp.]|nr:hypothetical protein [Nitrospira sp.]MDH4250694.1 hypothetical protein [Nitrospira sp.]MDH4342091.1 hypothetical protein [Nitrospira sp.]MDH5335256.1 hypothetical protein [Nitrospira sp.]
MLIVWAIAEGRKMAAGINQYLHVGSSPLERPLLTRSLRRIKRHLPLSFVLASFTPST